MNTSIVLTKEAEKVAAIVTRKSGGRKVLCNVGLDIDVSGSIKPLFDNGTIQRLIERVLPVAMTLDENKTLDMWAFSDAFDELKAVKEGNYSGYVQRNILDKAASLSLWQGTNYAPVLKANQNHFLGSVSGGASGFFSSMFKKKEGTNKEMPSVIYFFTDGANYDVRETTKLLDAWESEKLPLYVMFVGVGSSDFSFISKAGDKYPNVGFTTIRNLDQALNSDAIYDELVPQEMIDWFITSSSFAQAA